MSLPLNTSQGIADALGYLQHHLQELMERQHVSKSNINSTLAALTAQLQQLTQLVANPPLPLPAIPNTPPSPVPSPLVSLSSAPPMQWTCPKLSCPSDFNGKRHNGRAFLNSCSLYICLALEQFHDEQERILWALTFFKGGRATVMPLENFLWKCSMGYTLYPWISLLEPTLETSYKPQT